MASPQKHPGHCIPQRREKIMREIISRVLVVFSFISMPFFAAPARSQSQYPNYPSETPEHFQPATASFDYGRRIVMIPMRDGVKLHTVILVPKSSKTAPILLTRTPYDADTLTENSHSSHLASTLWGYDNATEVIVEGGYIRVVQDIRGRHNSEGDYVMNRPLHGALNPTPVDHSTDTYDTIDWLVKNVPETNGKVGVLGISYDGFWRDQAMDKILAAEPLKVPLMLVHSLWDQEDIYGAMAVYKAIKPKDTNNDKVFLVMGPWHHGQEIEDGSTLAALDFKSDTGLYFRQHILRPFLDHYLKDDAPASDVPPVSAFDSGTNEWRKLQSWPSGCAEGCSIKPTHAYLNPGFKLSFY